MIRLIFVWNAAGLAFFDGFPGQGDSVRTEAARRQDGHDTSPSGPSLPAVNEGGKPTKMWGDEVARRVGRRFARRAPPGYARFLFVGRFGFGGSTINSSRSPGVTLSERQSFSIFASVVWWVRLEPIFFNVDSAMPVALASLPYVMRSPVRRR